MLQDLKGLNFLQYKQIAISQCNAHCIYLIVETFHAMFEYTYFVL